jgi:hypothetical protein
MELVLIYIFKYIYTHKTYTYTQTYIYTHTNLYTFVQITKLYIDKAFVCILDHLNEKKQISLFN